MSPYAALAGRIRLMLTDLEGVIARTQLLLDKYMRTDDDGYLDGVALNLHGYYSGVERIFEDIAIEMGEGTPSGPNWHHELLLQMSAAINETRSPVISPAGRQCLDEYRGFCHVVRNVYTFNLRPTRLVDLTEALPDCYAIFREDIERFVDFLDQISR